ncbi:MAG: hypothetical protein WAW17_26115, partial [Rhodococcus sp. (in: high G+C Gram-positive bacteria)]|uniref:hypothetical protein n=1 Tax=Rhodococcus sp. TaxID=1831 RepID=UPI003BAEA0D3
RVDNDQFSGSDHDNDTSPVHNTCPGDDHNNGSRSRTAGASGGDEYDHGVHPTPDDSAIARVLL